MTALRIGLVAEGKTDQIVLSALLGAWCEAAGITAEFHDLQPSANATAGSSVHGSWTQVYAWCLRNPPSERGKYFLNEGPFSISPRYDLIVVHMDADICGEIRGKSSVQPVPSMEDGPEARGRFIHHTLLEWLWPDGATADGRHLPVPAVEAIEAWLVAALSGDADMPEADQDILRRLWVIDLRGRPVPDGARRMKKDPTRYRRLADRAAAAVADVAAKCPHFKGLADSLVATAG